MLWYEVMDGWFIARSALPEGNRCADTAQGEGGVQMADANAGSAAQASVSQSGIIVHGMKDWLLYLAFLSR